MRYDLVAIAGVAVICSAFVLLVVLYFVDKENKKHLREILDGTRKDWAKALDAVEELHSRENQAMKSVIASKDRLIEEKEKRIQDLENEIAMKNIVMAAAKLDGTIDLEKLKEMVSHIDV